MATTTVAYEDPDMMPARLAALLIPLLPVAPQSPEPELSLEYRADMLDFRVSGPESTFLGGVLLSLDPSVCHYLQGLPPLLCDYVVLGAGVARGAFVVSVPEHRLPPGVFIYAQGVVADENAIQSTRVIDFVLDGSKPIAGDPR